MYRRGAGGSGDSGEWPSCPLPWLRVRGSLCGTFCLYAAFPEPQSEVHNPSHSSCGRSPCGVPGAGGLESSVFTCGVLRDLGSMSSHPHPLLPHAALALADPDELHQLRSQSWGLGALQWQQLSPCQFPRIFQPCQAPRLVLTSSGDHLWVPRGPGVGALS